jgi:hypothetical protein
MLSWALIQEQLFKLSYFLETLHKVWSQEGKYQNFENSIHPSSTKWHGAN